MNKCVDKMLFTQLGKSVCKLYCKKILYHKWALLHTQLIALVYSHIEPRSFFLRSV